MRFWKTMEIDWGAIIAAWNSAHSHTTPFCFLMITASFFLSHYHIASHRIPVYRVFFIALLNFVFKHHQYVGSLGVLSYFLLLQGKICFDFVHIRWPSLRCNYINNSSFFFFLSSNREEYTLLRF